MNIRQLLYTNFRLAENYTDIKTEIRAGITTFLTMSYIIAVNPMILSLGGKGVPFDGAFAATILVACISSLLMGLYANLPFALAPGMGLNAFFAYTLVAGMGIAWQTALGVVFLSGVLFLLMSATALREKVVTAIPESIRYGTAAGIGLFLALIGLKSAGFIVASPATLVGFGGFNSRVIVFLAGLGFTAILAARNIPANLLFGIVFTTAAAATAGRIFPGEIMVKFPSAFLSHPDFSAAFMKLDITGALRPELAGAIFVFCFTDMFDSLSTFLGVSQAGGLLDQDGTPRNIGKALLADAISTVISGIAGSSSGTAYIESAAGIKTGARTGLAAVTAGLLFLPFLFLAPLVQMMPEVATAPALVMVGFYMMSAIGRVDFSDLGHGLPAFCAMILIPLCYSITQGICWSFIVWTVLHAASGKWKEIPPAIWIIDALALAALALQ